MRTKPRSRSVFAALSIAAAAGLNATTLRADTTVVGYQFTSGTFNATTQAGNLTASSFGYVNVNPSLPPYNEPPFIVTGGILADDPPFFVGQADWFSYSNMYDDNYYQFQVSVAPGYALNASSLSFEANSRQQVLFDSQVVSSTSPGFTSPVNWDAPFTIPTAEVWTSFSANSASITNGTGTYYFRVYNQLDPSGNGSISDLLNMGNFSLNGNVQVDASATPMYWDPGQSGAPGSGGAGTWLAGVAWADGAIDYAWSNTIPEAAYFAGSTGGNVTLGGNVTAGGLDFLTPGYTLSAAAGNTLTVSGTITTSASATISAPMTTSSAQTLTFNGSSVLTLSGSLNFPAGTSFCVAGGTLDISNTNLTLNGVNQVVGVAGQGSATLTVAGTSAFSTDHALILGNLGGNGTVNLQAGASLHAASLIIGAGASGNGGSGVFNENGGTLTTPTVTLGSGDPSATGAFNLNGGTLSVTAVAGGTGHSTFTFNGGTLQTTGDNASFVTGINQLQIASGGAIIDSNGHNITIAPPITAAPASTGGLTKISGGTLTLSGAPSYSGSTFVNAGEVVFQNPTSAFASNTVYTAGNTVADFSVGSNWQIGNSVTFTGTGTIQKYGSGVWTVGNTRLAGNFEMTSGLIDIEAGEIADADSESNFTANYASLNVAAGAVATIDTDDWQVDALTGGGTVRLNAPTPGLSLDVGIAGGSGTFSGTIKQDTGAGSDSLSLIKSGLGTETLTGTISYTGSTTVQAGRLTLVNNTPASSSLSISGGATLEYSDTTNLNLGSTTFTGTGTLLKTGPGKLILGNGTGVDNVDFSPGALIDIEDGYLTGSAAYGGNWTNNDASMNVASGATFDAVEAGPSSTMQIDALLGKGIFQGGYFGNAGGLSTVTIGVAGGGGIWSGSLRDDANAHLGVVKVGAGTETFTGSNTYTGGTKLNAGTIILDTAQSIPDSSVSIGAAGTLQLAQNIGAVNLQSLSIATGGKLDLSTNQLFISYGGGVDPIASIAAYIKGGYAGGAWNGSGIMSSAAQLNAGSYGIGYADSADLGNPAGLTAGTIEIAYTLLGDANLDGKVNGTDFAILATNFNQAVTSWDQGDFNYDGKDNGTDFAFLAANFNQGSSAADRAALVAFAAAHGLSSDVPEPASITVLGAGAVCLHRRKRRVEAGC